MYLHELAYNSWDLQSRLVKAFELNYFWPSRINLINLFPPKVFIHFQQTGISVDRTKKTYLSVYF